MGGCAAFLTSALLPRTPSEVDQGLTFLLGVCLNSHEDTVFPSVCELQSLEQALYLRLAVGTDHVEGISRLIGKLRFLKKNMKQKHSV